MSRGFETIYDYGGPFTRVEPSRSVEGAVASAAIRSRRGKSYFPAPECMGRLKENQQIANRHELPDD